MTASPPAALGDIPRGDQARRIRESAGWSRNRVAVALGVTEMTVTRWETGEFVPSGRNLLAYMRLLDQLATGGGT